MDLERECYAVVEIDIWVEGEAGGNLHISNLCTELQSIAVVVL